MAHLSHLSKSCPYCPFSSFSNGQGGGFERERDLLMKHRYALSPNVTPERFSVEGLRAAVGETVDLLASPAGMLVKSLVTRDPTAELLAIVDRLRPEGGPRLVEGSGPPGRETRTARGAHASRGVGHGCPGSRRQGDRGCASGGRFRYDAHPHRPGVFAARSRALIQRDVERVAAASLILVAAILLAVYRSPLALALGLVPWSPARSRESPRSRSASAPCTASRSASARP
jgi:hypothetical protein